MAELFDSDKRVRKDLLYLDRLLKKFHNSQTQSWLANNEEFVRIWDLFHNLRDSLIKIDESLFSKIRIIAKPEPTQNTYYPNGHYTRNHFEPLINEINLASEYFELYLSTSKKPTELFSVDEALIILTTRFGKVVRQLRNRHDNRTTIEIDDEYDMQDLFHSLLFLFFDDVRAEEWTPSYAGGSSRMDFLLKNEKVAIELKKTRKTMNSNELGKQLIVDIDKYKEHSEINKLVCFVYDTEFIIKNPKGIENDLSNDNEDFIVQVIIEPK